MVVMGTKGALDRAVLGAAHQARLQKIVLCWDYLRLLQESVNPKKRKGSKAKDAAALKKVGSSFKDINDYLSVFEPLLFEEVKAQIVRGQEEEDGGGAKEWRKAAVASCERANEFYTVRLALQAEYAEDFTENDLLVLSKGKLSSLSTILREYTALRSVGSLPFADLIFSAQSKCMDNDASSKSWNIPKPLMEYLEDNHNESQLEAIQGPPGTGKTQTILGLLGAVLHATPTRMQSKAGSLTIQHRPEPSFGEKYEYWVKASPWLNGINPRDMIMPMDGDDGFYPTTGNEFKPELVAAKRKHRVHVLVCAPSNSALDEIVLRLINSGIRDENGQVYNPSIVRVGLQAHHSVQSVSMDYLVEQRLSSVDRSAANAGGRVGTSTKDRDTVRAAILDEAAIVCSTLSFSGASVFSRMSRGFDVVIIDEAAQAVEPATLVPLAHGCRQVFLFGYGMSLFKRFQQAGYPVQMLKTQYRMHPQIREFPSREFYSEALEDGNDVLHQTKRPWHEYRCFGPFTFFDIEGEETQPTGSSWVNIEEVELVLALYRNLVGRYPELKAGSRLAVISPYKLQVKFVRERFREVLGPEAARLIDVNTVDGFQGREKDVAIFSCVRAKARDGIGFLSDFRRMNVGITRARASMLVVGSASTLMQDEHWSNLVKSAQQRKCLFKILLDRSVRWSVSIRSLWEPILNWPRGMQRACVQWRSL